MSVVHAIFENGVFKPTDPVDLQNGYGSSTIFP
jgi:predicted DNA-binding antitoxin AbrB/MazE fold protein